MAGSSSDAWRNRIAGLALMVFGLWGFVSRELPIPARQRVQGPGASVVGGLILLIGLVILVMTIPRREADQDQDDE